MKLFPILFIVGETAAHWQLQVGPRSHTFQWEPKFEFEFGGQKRTGAHVRRYETLKACMEEQRLMLGHRSTRWPVYSTVLVKAESDEEKTDLEGNTPLMEKIAGLEKEVGRLLGREQYLLAICKDYEEEAIERAEAERKAEVERLARIEAQRGPKPDMSATEDAEEESPDAAGEAGDPPPPPGDDDEKESSPEENAGNPAGQGESTPPTPAGSSEPKVLSKAERRDAARQEAIRRAEAAKTQDQQPAAQ